MIIVAENAYWYTRIFVEGPNNKVITVFRPLSIWQKGNYFYFIPYKYKNILAPSDDYYIRSIRLGRDDMDYLVLDWGRSANDKIILYGNCIVNKLKSAVIGNNQDFEDTRQKNLLEEYDLTYLKNINSNSGLFLSLVLYLILFILLLLLCGKVIINVYLIGIKRIKGE